MTAPSPQIAALIAAAKAAVDFIDDGDSPAVGNIVQYDDPVAQAYVNLANLLEEVRDALQAAAAPVDGDDEPITNGNVAQFQDEVRDFLIDECSRLGLHADGIDGGGSDSGDWRDFTMSEIRQGVNMIVEHFQEAAPIQPAPGADHLAGSGPAGEIADLKAQLAASQAKETDMRRRVLRDGEDGAKVIAMLMDELSTAKDRARFYSNGRDIAVTQLAQANEYIDELKSERDTARQECEAQKARAIRAEGERDEYIKLARQLTLNAEEAWKQAEARQQQILDSLTELLGLTGQALTPAPDHAKGEQQ